MTLYLINKPQMGLGIGGHSDPVQGRSTGTGSSPGAVQFPLTYKRGTRGGAVCSPHTSNRQYNQTNE